MSTPPKNTRVKLDVVYMARLDERQNNILDKIVEVKEALSEIHKEFQETNGRISELEAWKSEVKGSFRITTIVLSALSSMFGAVASFIITQIFNL